jgi:hypothetical protein
MEIPQTLAVEPDSATVALFEQQQRELQRYQTRYVYAPFMDPICAQVPVGYVPAGAIHPIAAPKGKINKKALPEGAQVLQVVSPSVGVPGPPSKPKQFDPTLQALNDRIAQLESDVAERRKEPPSIAIYLHDVVPIVANLVSVYAREGLVEIRSLFGLPDAAFEKYRFNDLLFGPEGERPVTARGVRERMNAIIKQATAQKGEGALKLLLVAGEIVKSVDLSEAFAREHIRLRHIAMDDPNDPEPKRYSRRDIRALEFAEIERRELVAQQTAAEQRMASQATPMLLEAMERRDKQMEKVFEGMTEALKAITKPTKKGE